MMSRTLKILLILWLFCFQLPARQARSEPGGEHELWPKIEPFQTGYLTVSKLHKIYYELVGNPLGKAVFVLHGGPGGSCSPEMRRFFNPEKFLIVLHDQRGAGKSKPYAEIRENTTWDLVEDIERLRKHLKVQKLILFGGSWGATLGLAYGEKYPGNVSGMVLRGVFLATQKEIDHFYHGGVRSFFPQLYDQTLGPLRKNDKRPLPEILLELVQSKDPAVREKYSKIWARYEFEIAVLVSDKKWVDSFFSKSDVMDKIYAFSLLENYYMANGCFLEEGQLMREAGRLKDIPIIMVNGRYDMICPPLTAYQLSKKLPKSKLVIAEGAGHWLGDKPVERALIEAMKELE